MFCRLQAVKFSRRNYQNIPFLQMVNFSFYLDFKPAFQRNNKFKKISMVKRCWIAFVAGIVIPLEILRLIDKRIHLSHLCFILFFTELLSHFSESLSSFGAGLLQS